MSRASRATIRPCARAPNALPDGRSPTRDDYFVLVFPDRSSGPWHYYVFSVRVIRVDVARIPGDRSAVEIARVYARSCIRTPHRLARDSSAGIAIAALVDLSTTVIKLKLTFPQRRKHCGADHIPVTGVGIRAIIRDSNSLLKRLYLSTANKS